MEGIGHGGGGLRGGIIWDSLFVEFFSFDPPVDSHTVILCQKSSWTIGKSCKNGLKRFSETKHPEAW